MSKLSQKGDTIVEVLIAMTVLATVLGGAFAVTNQALKLSQAAQERIEATKLAEGQLERLKAMSATSDPNFTGVVVNTCISDNMVASNKSSADCTNVSGRYDVWFSSVNPYTINIEWDSATSDSRSSLKFLYRVN